MNKSNKSIKKGLRKHAISLHETLRRKKLEELANLAGKIKMNITVNELLKLRNKKDF